MPDSSRRNIVTALLALVVSAATTTRSGLLAQEGANENSAEEWMDAWITTSKPPIGTLHISRFAEPIYFLTKEIAWRPDPGQESMAPVVVPVGFTTDFASVPRIFWSLVRPDGEYSYAAIIHDYLYWIQDRTREEADALFRVVMKEFSINSATVEIVYRAVRLGGGSPWEDNARRKVNGEKRVLKEFPVDPRVRWEQWKRKPEIFK